METERMALNQRERDRLRVLHEIRRKHITPCEAAKRLKISDRHIRRLLVGLGKHGDRALLHGLRGRPSNRRLAARFEQQILRRVRERYADFGPTLAAEHLAQEDLRVSRETLRKWMVKASLWRPRAQRIKTIHVWRERRASFGELVMQDSSPFRWLEERGPACQLIAVIDDATSRFYARFTERDTTEENLRTFGEWLGRATRRSLRGSSRCAGGNRATTGWLVLATLPRSLSPPAPLPSTRAARGKSFRPTACRTHRPYTLKSLQKCSSQPPMADISIWQKTGHFYFALIAWHLFP
jgi:hypothetical protein